MARTPPSLEELLGEMRKWAHETVSLFNDSLEHPRNGVKLTDFEWSLMEQQILKDRDGIRTRNGCSWEDAMGYALAWNNVLFRGEGPLTMQKLMRQCEPNLVRAGLINLGLEPAKVVQPEHIWEGGNLIKFFGTRQPTYSPKAIYIGITERTGYRAAQDIALALHDFVSRNQVKVYVVDLPHGGDTTAEAQENMHLDFKMNWFVEEDGKQAVVLNTPALQKSAGKEKKFYRVRELVYRTDEHDLQQARTYLPAETSEEIISHFERLRKEGVVSEVHMLKQGEHEFGANFVDGVTTGSVFIAPTGYRHLNEFVCSRGRKPVLFDLANNAAFGSIRCSTTSFYAAGKLREILGAPVAAKYITKALGDA